MPDHLESMRQEVMQTEKASFFKLHNLSGDRCCLFWSLPAWPPSKVQFTLQHCSALIVACKACSHEGATASL